MVAAICLLPWFVDTVPDNNNRILRSWDCGSSKYTAQAIAEETREESLPATPGVHGFHARIQSRQQPSQPQCATDAGYSMGTRCSGPTGAAEERPQHDLPWREDHEDRRNRSHL